MNETIIITVHNPVLSSVSPMDGNRLIEVLSYSHVWYNKEMRRDDMGNVIINDQGQPLTYMKRNVSTKEAFISKGTEWFFHTGLLHRVTSFCSSNNINYHINYLMSQEELFYDERTQISDNFVLHDFQESLVMRTAQEKRGLIKSATGTGKTIMQIAICDWFVDSQILILAHTKSIIVQTYKKLAENGFEKDIQQIGAGAKFTGFTHPIVISTIQSFVKIPPELYENYFDIVMVDECHHLSNCEYSYGKSRGKKSGQYVQVLENLMAPMRIGFTATPPEIPQTIFACEGLLGPIIGEMSLQDATDIGVLAKPLIKIIKLTPQAHVRKLRKYPDVYREGIVQNLHRNTKILDIAQKHVSKGETVLIFVTHLEHGERIYNLAKQTILKDTISYVRGSVDAESREMTRLAFRDKEVKCVIATSCWTEGIDVPSLDAIIMGTSEKSAKQTIQRLGRGLRKTDNKEEVTIYDFFDSSHNLLVSHFGERFALYCDLGFVN